MNCPKCNSELKTVPAGTSKKPPYKPYNAFIACSNRECSFTQNMANKPLNVNSEPLIAPPAPKPRNYDAENLGKCKFGFMKELLKLNNQAPSLGIKPMGKDELEDEAEDLARRSMRIKGEPEIKQYTDNIEVTEIPFN